MAKIERRLYPSEAEMLGLKVKKNEHNRKNARYRITQEQHDAVKEFRAAGILESCESMKVEAATVKHLWKKNEGASLFIKNPLYVTPLEKTYLDLRDAIIPELQKYSPKFKKIKRQKYKDAHLLVMDPADVHIGKLASSFETGEDYNNQIAVQRVLDGVDGILQKTQGYNIDKVLFIGGNDILHIDTPKRQTTSGTPQDTDGMWYENFLIAKKLYIDVLEKLLAVADVHFTFNPSNHDYTNGFFLADVIQTYFKHNKNITFDCSISHRKYFKYYNNLIGTTHGDGAKEIDLPILMAQESPQYWSETKHRYIYTHHVHHKNAKDRVGVTIESLRSPSGTDSWHHRNGYQHNPKAVEGFLHSKEHGQIARLTHLF